MKDSKISWTNNTWNPVSGCSKISSGCKYCYAEKISHKFGYTKKDWINKNINENLKTHYNRLNQPTKWHGNKMVFVNSMSDFFHSNIDPNFVMKIFNIMNQCSNHIFQILTKRSDNIKIWNDYFCENMWIGVSVEDNKSAFRIDDLKNSKAFIKFVSFEPLLEDIKNIDLSGIDWVIVGGESGANYRTMEHSWAVNIKIKCQRLNIPFFFKQSSGYRSGMGEKLYENGIGTFIQEYPQFSFINNNHNQLDIF